MEQALRALHSQTVRDFELVVIDSGSTERTLDIVRGYSPVLLEIIASAYVPAPVLNQAIERSTGGFQPTLFHRLSKKSVGRYNGPAWVQRRDAERRMDGNRAGMLAAK